MKRFYSIILCTFFAIGTLFAQDTPSCDADTAFINSGAIVQPTPIQNDTLGDGLPDACINTPYNLTMFLHPPSSFAVGTINVPVTSFRIDSVINLPDGLSYECSAPDCTFPADSINCIFLSGTPSDANESELYELTIHLTVSAGGLGFAATFPDPALAPGSYHIILHPEGDTACQTSTPVLDHNPIAETINVFPNPGEDQITLAFDSKLNSMWTTASMEQLGFSGENTKCQYFPGTGSVSHTYKRSACWILHYRTSDGRRQFQIEIYQELMVRSISDVLPSNISAEPMK